MRILAPTLLPALLTGCIIYDNDGDWDGDDRRDHDTDRDEDRDGDDEEPDEPAASFAFEPSEAEVGEAFIGYLTVLEGEVDLAATAEVVVYGDVELSD